MVRPLRLEYPGAVYHVMSRGDARKSITRAESDKSLFLEVLAEATKNYNVLFHSYCLMTNHYHLLKRGQVVLKRGQVVNCSIPLKPPL